jgi:hypothetical protein
LTVTCSRPVVSFAMSMLVLKSQPRLGDWNQ